MDAVVARTDGTRRHPLCACYHVSVLPVAQAQLQSGNYAMGRLLDMLDNVCYVDVPAHPLCNINAPADLAATGAC